MKIKKNNKKTKDIDIISNETNEILDKMDYEYAKKDSVFISKEYWNEPKKMKIYIKNDSGKLRYDLIPPEALKALAEVLTFGASKYDENTWQELPNFEARYIAAAMRHFEAYRAGEKIDSESGLHHLSHAMCNIAFLIWKEKQKNITEDL